MGTLAALTGELLTSQDAAKLDTALGPHHCIEQFILLLLEKGTTSDHSLSPL